MAMGNPLSPLLANLYMEFFERDMLKPLLPKNALWYRYVDDILCLWPSDKNDHDFLNRINSLVPSIKFTVEREVDKCIPFLDVKIHKNSNGFEFNVYRKPTNNCSYVHFYSNHHPNVKKSVFTSMFLRAFRVVSPKYFDAEINEIKSIGFDLKYPEEFLNSCFAAARKSYFNTPSNQFNFKNVLNLPFFNEFVHLPASLKKLNINVVFHNKNILRNLLIKNSPDSHSGCIYRIPCIDCDRFYIGQTGKSLEVRIKQHKYSVRTGQLSNALFVHMSETDHVIDWKTASIIKYNKSMVERNIIESAIIQNKFNDNLNLSTGLFTLDKFIIARIIKHVT